MVVVGGLRVRLTFESVFNMVNDSLTALGWFDAGRSHGDVTFRSEPVDSEDEVPLNTLVLVGEDRTSSDIELGSVYAEHTRIFYLDFYAESYSLGEHVIYDLQDLLEGRYPSIGRGAPTVTVYDYRVTPTPTEISVAEISDVIVDRARQFIKPWQKHWWSIQFIVTDEYGDENF